MTYPITTLTASLLGLWLVWLSIRVISARGSEGVQLGSGNSEKLERRIRGQANLSEYAPSALVLLFLAELQSGSSWMVLTCAGLLLVGRLIHGIAFSFTDKWVLGRVGGMLFTFGSIILLSLLNIWHFLAS